jgi:transcriptional regulator with XRE-family HTH domain
VKTVQYWTGREVRCLRQAHRMSIREFAEHLGVSDRMVSKWEAAGEQIRPRPVNQAALDTVLARSAPDVRDRFAGWELPGGRRPRSDPDAGRELHRVREMRPAMPTGGEASERAVREQLDAIERQLDVIGELIDELHAMIAAVVEADSRRGQDPL